MNKTSTEVSYMLRVPIYGYSGMGYAHLNHVEESFETIEKAIERSKRYSAAFSFAETHPAEISYEQYEALAELHREMTDIVSFSIRGEPKLFKVTTITEELN